MALSVTTPGTVSGTDSNARHVSDIRGIDPLIMTIGSLWGCLPEMIVTVEDVVDGHHFVAANFDGQFFYDDAAQVLNHGPVDISAVQRDREGQPRGPGYNHVMRAKVGEPNKQLLVLVDAARIVGDDQKNCRTPLTPKDSRSDLYGLSLRPNLLEAMMY